MASVIQQSVILKAPPEALFNSFLDSKRPTARRGVTAGWPRYYWQPWKAYLARG
jgi:hypothetical protein